MATVGLALLAYRKTQRLLMQYEYALVLRELGDRIRKIRTDRGLSHRQMVSEHGFHLNQLHRIENGDPVSFQTLLKLCAAFDLSLSELLNGLGETDIAG